MRAWACVTSFTNSARSAWPSVVLSASLRAVTRLQPWASSICPGGGPGLVGDPALALLGVLGIAVLSVVATLAYVRLTGGPRRDKPEDRPRPW